VLASIRRPASFTAAYAGYEVGPRGGLWTSCVAMWPRPLAMARVVTRALLRQECALVRHTPPYVLGVGLLERLERLCGGPLANLFNGPLKS